MDASTWLILGLIVLACIFFAAWLNSYHRIPPNAGSYADYINSLAQPGMGSILSGWEARKALARTFRNQALLTELQTHAQLVEAHVTAQGLVSALIGKANRQLALEIEIFHTAFCRERNIQSAFNARTQDGYRLEFWEQLQFALMAGEIGRTLTEIERKRAMDQLELNRLNEEHQITFDHNVRLSEWKDERMQRLLKGKEDNDD